MKLLSTNTFTFLFLFFATVLSAQKGEKVPGYVLLDNGRKVEGLVKVGDITDNEVKVTFYNGRTGQKQVYKSTEIQGYGYEGFDIDELGNEIEEWTHYEAHKVDYPPKPFGPTTVFMQKEEEGAVTLFVYYIENRSDVKNPYRYNYYLLGENGQLEKIERNTFSSVASNVFGDYTALSGRVGKKDFTYRNLDRMVRDYNYWVVNQHDRTEYRVAMKQN